MEAEQPKQTITFHSVDKNKFRLYGTILQYGTGIA